MARLQEWIYKLEVGEGTRYLKFGAAVLLFAALAFLFDLRDFKDFSTREAMDTAQVARNLAEGNGFSTKFIRPVSLYLLQINRPDHRMMLNGPHPDLANPPLYPLLLAGWMKLLPFHFHIAKGAEYLPYQPEVLIAVLNQGLFLLVLLLLFGLAKRIFDPSVAWMATALFAATLLFWKFSISGLPTLFAMILLLGLGWILWALEEKGTDEKRSATWFAGIGAAAGLLVGAAGLTLYSLACLLIPLLAYFLLFHKGRRLVLCLPAVILFLGVMAPWLIRNLEVSRTLFGTASYALQEQTKYFPKDRLERSLTPDFGHIQFHDYVRKGLENFREILSTDLPKFGGNWIAAFFLVGLLVPFHAPARSRLRLFVLLALLTLIAAEAMGRTDLSKASPVLNSENFLVLLAPFIFMFGAALCSLLADQLDLPFPEWRRWLTGGVVGIFSLPLIMAFLPPRIAPIAFPPYYPPTIQLASGWMQKDEMMMSDVPWAVAWYGDRTCLWNTLGDPSSPNAAFYTINDGPRPIHALYLTPVTLNAKFLNGILLNKASSWGGFVMDCLLRTNVPTGFPLRDAPVGFLPYQFFLTDRPRW